MENRTPAFYAVIPASVRYDTELRPNAKLLYGELSALATQEGYCWAKNKYFADLFGLSQKTISELLKQLAEHGHIRIEVIRDPETQEVIQRRLWIAGPSGAAVPPSSEKSGEGGYPENSGETSPEKNGDPPPKNREENYTSLSNPSKTPLYPPKGGGAGGQASTISPRRLNRCMPTIHGMWGRRLRRKRGTSSGPARRSWRQSVLR